MWRASPTDLLALQENCRRSEILDGILPDRHSHVFMTTEVGATGLWSSTLVLFCFFGTAMMAEALKQAGTWHVCSEMLKMSVNTGNNWSAQHFRMETDIVLVLCRCSVSCFHLFQVWRKVSWEIKKLLKGWNNLCAHAKTLLPFPASSQLSLHSLGVNKVLSLI